MYVVAFRTRVAGVVKQSKAAATRNTGTCSLSVTVLNISLIIQDQSNCSDPSVVLQESNSNVGTFSGVVKRKGLSGNEFKGRASTLVSKHLLGIRHHFYVHHDCLSINLDLVGSRVSHLIHQNQRKVQVNDCMHWEVIIRFEDRRAGLSDRKPSNQRIGLALRYYIA